MKTVNIELWSDFVCPWCWIARKRLDQAVASLAGEIDVTVKTRSYRLAKGVAPLDFTRALHDKFGDAAAADAMMAAVGENGRSEGLVYNFNTMRFGDTSDAHALVKSFGTSPLAGRVTERLYRAATTDGIDIFDRAALKALARDVGATDLAIDFDSPAVATAIARDEAKANSIANGVPLFVFNDSSYLSGAQPAATFERALRSAAIDMPPSLDTDSAAVCDIDGCSA